VYISANFTIFAFILFPSVPSRNRVSHGLMYVSVRGKPRILECFIPLTVALDFAKSDVNRLSNNGGFLDAEITRTCLIGLRSFK
jgi:hypothetical protein